MVKLTKNQSMCKGEKTCGDCQVYTNQLAGYNFNGTYVFSNADYELVRRTVGSLAKSCPENEHGAVWSIQRGE